MIQYRRKIGIDVAVEALRDCWQNRQATADELWRYASICRVTNVMQPWNLAASVHDRLLNLAHSRREELQSVLTRYAVERLLYRLSRSKAEERFVLKGAVLFYLWEGDLHRPTRDVDFLGLGDPTIASVTEALRDVCTTAVEDDGVVFLGETIRAQEIRCRSPIANYAEGLQNPHRLGIVPSASACVLVAPLSADAPHMSHGQVLALASQIISSDPWRALVWRGGWQ